MAEVLNLDIVTAEKRKLILSATPKRNLVDKVLRRNGPKQIVIEIPPYSFRQSLELTTKYIKFLNMTIRQTTESSVVPDAENEEDFFNKTLESSMNIRESMVDIVITALNPMFPDISQDWITKNIQNEEAIPKIFDFLMQPIQEKIEKNAKALQGLKAPKN